LVTSNLDTNT